MMMAYCIVFDTGLTYIGIFDTYNIPIYPMAVKYTQYVDIKLHHHFPFQGLTKPQLRVLVYILSGKPGFDS
jgi:hypothetical protein